MTIICALNDEKEKCVWLGSNDRCALDNIIVPGNDPKWVQLGEWVIGVSGFGPRTEALSSMLPEFSKKKKLTISDVATQMRDAFKEFDFGEDDDGVKRFCGQGIIVNADGRIWDYDGSIALTEIFAGEFWSRGSGMEMAIGASKALRSCGISGVELVTRTVSTVIENDMDCPGMSYVEKLDRNGVLSVAYSRDIQG